MTLLSHLAHGLGPTHQVPWGVPLMWNSIHIGASANTLHRFATQSDAVASHPVAPQAEQHTLTIA